MARAPWPNKNRYLSWVGIAIPAFALVVTAIFFHRTIQRVEQMSNVMPLDTYFYQSIAANIDRGKGPLVEWPQGPQNKYFPGFAYWWSFFLHKNIDPDLAVRDFALAQTTLLVLLMIGLIAAGRALWKDWPLAFTFAALAGSAPVLLKWSFVPLAELLATVCITGSLYFGIRLWNAEREAKASQRRRLLAGLVICGAAGFFTRLETGLFLFALCGGLVAFRRISWRQAAIVGIIAATPVALWQVWVNFRVGAASYYVAEGTGAFRAGQFIDLFFFQMLNVLRVQNVGGPNALADRTMFLLYLLFMVSLILSLRGYCGKISMFSALLMVLYWFLHSFWYYQTDRYNMMIIPFACIVLLEGIGRLISMRQGWMAPGARRFLPLIVLIAVPVFLVHANDNIWAMVRAFNQQKRPPSNAVAIQAAVRGSLDAATYPVILTNLSIPEARRLPGRVWFFGVFENDPCMDKLPRLFEEGQAEEFIRREGVTHLALQPAAAVFLDENKDRFQTTVIYSDEMILLAQINRR